MSANEKFLELLKQGKGALVRAQRAFWEREQGLRTHPEVQQSAGEQERTAPIHRAGGTSSAR
jgi:hypothetical protein